MTDSRNVLERDLARVGPAPFGFDDVARRRDRKRRNQRIRAGVVGMALFVAALLVVTTFGFLGQATMPSGEGTTGPAEIGPAETRSEFPQPEPTGISVTAPWFDRNVSHMCGGDPGADCGDDYTLDLESGTMGTLPERIRRGDGYAVSPDGSEVAYIDRAEDGRQVFVAQLNGTQIRQVTHEPPVDAAPSRAPYGPLAWSPDGTTIAYLDKAVDGGQQVFVVDLESERTSQVTFEPEWADDPQFSPDGASILYTAERAGDPEVRIAPIAGGEGSTLMERTWGASLSPDGSLLAYGCNTHVGAGSDGSLCLANADGSNPRVLITASVPLPVMQPNWSPDGTRLVCWVFHSWDVYVIDVASGETTLVGKGASPSWVDDHTLIIEIYHGPR